MKRNRNHSRPNETAPVRAGSWAFNLVSESLFALGSTEQVRRVAYRGPDGQIKFLPTPRS